MLVAFMLAAGPCVCTLAIPCATQELFGIRRMYTLAVLPSTPWHARPGWGIPALLGAAFAALAPHARESWPVMAEDCRHAVGLAASAACNLMLAVRHCESMLVLSMFHQLGVWGATFPHLCSGVRWGGWCVRCGHCYRFARSILPRLSAFCGVQPASGCDRRLQGMLLQRYIQRRMCPCIHSCRAVA
jgi:hypothetical protein